MSNLVNFSQYTDIERYDNDNDNDKEIGIKIEDYEINDDKEELDLQLEFMENPEYPEVVIPYNDNEELNIPLEFWYNKDNRLAIPEVVMPYKESYTNPLFEENKNDDDDGNIKFKDINELSMFAESYNILLSLSGVEPLKYST